MEELLEVAKLAVADAQRLEGQGLGLRFDVEGLTVEGAVRHDDWSAAVRAGGADLARGPALDHPAW